MRHITAKIVERERESQERESRNSKICDFEISESQA
jgi:hypothetical protein